MPVVLRWILSLGITNPITVRLVQNGSRRTRHLFIRAGYLGVLIAVLLYALLLNARGDELSYQQLAKAGSLSFKYIAYLQIGLICVLAPVFMAGAIAQEADPKTWDILLTTPLSSTQIVLGNLLGRLLFILALLFSSLPLFAVTQYFGGVPGTSIFGSYLIAACAALLVGATAIGLSVSRLVGKRAVFAFYTAVVSYLALTYAIDAVRFGGASVSWMTAINPFLALQALLDPSGYPRALPGTHRGMAAWFLENPVTTWCVLSGGLAVAQVLISILTVRLGGFVAVTGAGGGAAGEGGSGGSGGAAPWYRRMLGLGAAGAQTRPVRWVWHNPIAWREAAARNATLWRILARWAFVVAGAAFGVVLVVVFARGGFTASDFRTTLLYTVVSEFAVITLIALNMAATSISREREDGTLDLLLTTPITQRDYLSGKQAGIIAYLLPLTAVPVGTLILAGVYGLFAGTASTVAYLIPGSAPPMTVNLPVVLPESGLLAAMVMVPFLALCVIIGMQWSLKSKGTIGATMGAVAVVAVVGGTIGLCGFQAGRDLPVLGPVLAGLSPLSVVHASCFAEDGLNKTIIQSDARAARVGLFIGALVAAGAYAGLVLMIRSHMIRTFDMTVRRLAGTR